MQVQINPEAEFSTGEVERMLNLGSKGRVKLLIEKGLVPARRVNANAKSGTASHYRVKFKDFAKVLEADKKVRKLNTGDPQLVVRRSEWNEMLQRIESMEQRIVELTGLIDDYTSPNETHEVADALPAR